MEKKLSTKISKRIGLLAVITVSVCALATASFELFKKIKFLKKEAAEYILTIKIQF
jgi:hypothetical protein